MEVNNKWKLVWDRKGKLKTSDLKELNGFEATTVNPKIVAQKITKFLCIKKEDRILEVGCGAGMLSQYLKCHYIGIDYSKSLIKRHIELLNKDAFVAEANNIPFPSKYFDKVFAYSIFQYFPNKEYVAKTISEMKRVSKGNIFIGDLPESSHRESHMLFCRDDFQGIISEGFYTSCRFNVVINNE